MAYIDTDPENIEFIKDCYYLNEKNKNIGKLKYLK